MIVTSTYTAVEEYYFPQKFYVDKDKVEQYEVVEARWYQFWKPSHIASNQVEVKPVIESKFNYYLRNTLIFVVWLIVNCISLMLVGTLLTIIMMFFAFLDCLDRLLSGGRRGGNRP